jgi:hypothetical protein
MCGQGPLCVSLVDHIKAQFGKGPARPMPDVHIHHPDHAPIVDPTIPVARDFGRTALRSAAAVLSTLLS